MITQRIVLGRLGWGWLLALSALELGGSVVLADQARRGSAPPTEGRGNDGEFTGGAGWSRALEVQVRSVLGLRIPADGACPVTLAVLRLTASVLSDAIGGGQLEDALTAERDGGGYPFYLDEHRVAKGLPLNGRAAVLADPAGTIVVEGDVGDPEKLLANPELLSHIDFRRPVAVIAAAILHFVSDEQDPARIIRAFRDVMAPGSALVVTHATEAHDVNGEDVGIREGARIYTESAAPIVIRSPAQVAGWFDGFALVAPGLVAADDWRRTGNGRVTAPVVAGVGLLAGPGIGTGATGSGSGLARPHEGERRDG